MQWSAATHTVPLFPRSTAPCVQRSVARRSALSEPAKLALSSPACSRRAGGLHVGHAGRARALVDILPCIASCILAAAALKLHLSPCTTPAHLQGFGCRVLAFDVSENEELKAQGVTYCSLEQLLSEVGRWGAVRPIVLLMARQSPLGTAMAPAATALNPPAPLPRLPAAERHCVPALPAAALHLPHHRCRAVRCCRTWCICCSVNLSVVGVVCILLTHPIALLHSLVQAGPHEGVRRTGSMERVGCLRCNSCTVALVIVSGWSTALLLLLPSSADARPCP